MKHREKVYDIFCYWKLLYMSRKNFLERGSFSRHVKAGKRKVYHDKYGDFN